MVVGRGVGVAGPDEAGSDGLGVADTAALGDEVGSSEEAPLVGAGNPNRNDLGQLDLILDPVSGADVSDQYGARWAATRGSTPIWPGNC